MDMDMAKDMRIDFHAHVLPGLDHGCSDIEMAKRQLKYEKDNGIDLVIATSHFYPHLHTVNDFLEMRKQAAELMKEYIDDNYLYPQVVLGAEVLLCNNLDRMPGLHYLCIDKTNVLLVEFPLTKKLDKSLIETVLRIKNQLGLRVILAHADRYDYKSVCRLLDLDIGVQLNVDAINNIKTRFLCKRYVNTKKVFALGSDIHGVPKKANKFKKAIKILGTDADDIMKKTSELLNVHIKSD